MQKLTRSPFRRGRRTKANKRWRRPKKRYRATTNLTEGKKNSKKYAQKTSCSTGRVHKRSQNARSMDGYKTRTENDSEEEEEEDISEGNHKQPSTNHIEGGYG